MKYFTEYLTPLTNKLHADNHVFCTYDKDTFEAEVAAIKKALGKEDVEIQPLGYGFYLPKELHEKYIKERDAVMELAIAQDIEENGLEGIIRRELANYESFYTRDYSDAASSLSKYKDITPEMIDATYRAEYKVYVANDWI